MILLINAVHRTIKMKPIDVTSDSYAECNEDFNKKDPKFQNIETFLPNDTLQIDRMKFLLLVGLKIQFLGLMLLVT